MDRAAYANVNPLLFPSVRRAASPASPGPRLQYRVQVQPKWSTTLWADKPGLDDDPVKAQERADDHTRTTGELARIVPVAA